MPTLNSPVHCALFKMAHVFVRDAPRWTSQQTAQREHQPFAERSGANRLHAVLGSAWQYAVFDLSECDHPELT
jgi:hypothetical protein